MCCQCHWTHSLSANICTHFDSFRSPFDDSNLPFWSLISESFKINTLLWTAFCCCVFFFLMRPLGVAKSYIFNCFNVILILSVAALHWNTFTYKPLNVFYYGGGKKRSAMLAIAKEPLVWLADGRLVSQWCDENIDMTDNLLLKLKWTQTFKKFPKWHC